MTKQRQWSEDALLQQKLEQCEALYDSLLAEKAHNSRLRADLERHKQRADAAEREAAGLREQLAAARRSSDLSSSSSSISVDVLLLQRKLDKRGVELLMMQQEVQELQASLKQQRYRAEDSEAAAAGYREAYLRLWRQLATTLSFANLGSDQAGAPDWASLDSRHRRSASAASSAAAVSEEGGADLEGEEASGGRSAQDAPSEAAGPTQSQQLPPSTAGAGAGTNTRAETDSNADADAGADAAEEEAQQPLEAAAWSERSSEGADLRHVSTMTCTSFDSTEGGGPDIDTHIFSTSIQDPATDPTAAAAAEADELQHMHTGAVKWAAAKAKAALLPAVAVPAATQAPPAPGCVVARRERMPAGSAQKDLKRGANLSMSPELISVWRSVDCDN